MNKRALSNIMRAIYGCRQYYTCSFKAKALADARYIPKRSQRIKNKRRRKNNVKN